MVVSIETQFVTQKTATKQHPGNSDAAVMRRCIRRPRFPIDVGRRHYQWGETLGALRLSNSPLTSFVLMGLNYLVGL